MSNVIDFASARRTPGSGKRTAALAAGRVLQFQRPLRPEELLLRTLQSKSTAPDLRR